MQRCKGNKQYVVYKDSLDEISASILGTDGDDIAFYPINTDEEWDLVERELERRNIYGQRHVLKMRHIV